MKVFITGTELICVDLSSDEDLDYTVFSLFSRKLLDGGRFEGTIDELLEYLTTTPVKVLDVDFDDVFEDAETIRADFKF